jgi:hypothetical protein
MLDFMGCSFGKGRMPQVVGLVVRAELLGDGAISGHTVAGIDCWNVSVLQRNSKARSLSCSRKLALGHMR